MLRHLFSSGAWLTELSAAATCSRRLQQAELQPSVCTDRSSLAAGVAVMSLPTPARSKDTNQTRPFCPRKCPLLLSAVTLGGEMTERGSDWRNKKRLEASERPGASQIQEDQLSPLLFDGSAA